MGVTYDSAGNLTAWGGSTFSYGPFNEMWRSVAGGEEWLHLYTAGGQRLWSYRVSGAGFAKNRYTLRGLDNKVEREYTYNRDALTWSLDRETIYLGTGQQLAAVVAGATQHLHLDHLGTPRLVTNAAGARLAYHVYTPFGEEITALNQEPSRLKFTGHERDLGDGSSVADDLDYMHARYYNPQLGRFASADPIVDPWRPQRLNRYAYVLGNPMKYTDPWGLFEDDTTGGYGDEIVVTGTAIPVAGVPSGIGGIGGFPGAQGGSGGAGGGGEQNWLESLNERVSDWLMLEFDNFAWPCAPYSYGMSLDYSLIGEGSPAAGAIGVNLQYVPGVGVGLYGFVTEDNSTSHGIDIGATLTTNVAFGKGPWEGPFPWAGGSLGALAVGGFGSPASEADVGRHGIQGGWAGAGIPQGGFGTTVADYTLLTDLSHLHPWCT